MRVTVLLAALVVATAASPIAGSTSDAPVSALPDCSVVYLTVTETSTPAFCSASTNALSWLSRTMNASIPLITASTVNSSISVTSSVLGATSAPTIIPSTTFSDDVSSIISTRSTLETSAPSVTSKTSILGSSTTSNALLSSSAPTTIFSSSTSSHTGPYYFSIVNGTTQWENGDAPPTTYTSFVIQTSTVWVTPSPEPASTIYVTQTSIETDSTTVIVSETASGTPGGPAATQPPISSLAQPKFVTAAPTGSSENPSTTPYGAPPVASSEVTSTVFPGVSTIVSSSGASLTSTSYTLGVGIPPPLSIGSSTSLDTLSSIAATNINASTLPTSVSNGVGLSTGALSSLDSTVYHGRSTTAPSTLPISFPGSSTKISLNPNSSGQSTVIPSILPMTSSSNEGTPISASSSLTLGLSTYSTTSSPIFPTNYTSLGVSPIRTSGYSASASFSGGPGFPTPLVTGSAILSLSYSSHGEASSGTPGMSISPSGSQIPGLPSSRSSESSASLIPFYPMPPMSTVESSSFSKSLGLSISSGTSLAPGSTNAVTTSPALLSTHVSSGGAAPSFSGISSTSFSSSVSGPSTSEFSSSPLSGGNLPIPGLPTPSSSSGYIIPSFQQSASSAPSGSHTSNTLPSPGLPSAITTFSSYVARSSQISSSLALTGLYTSNNLPSPGLRSTSSSSHGSAIPSSQSLTLSSAAPTVSHTSSPLTNPGLSSTSLSSLGYVMPSSQALTLSFAAPTVSHTSSALTNPGLPSPSSSSQGFGSSSSQGLTLSSSTPTGSHTSNTLPNPGLPSTSSSSGGYVSPPSLASTLGSLSATASHTSSVFPNSSLSSPSSSSSGYVLPSFQSTSSSISTTPHTVNGSSSSSSTYIFFTSYSSSSSLSTRSYPSAGSSGWNGTMTSTACPGSGYVIGTGCVTDFPTASIAAATKIILDHGVPYSFMFPSVTGDPDLTVSYWTGLYPTPPPSTDFSLITTKFPSTSPEPCTTDLSGLSTHFATSTTTDTITVTSVLLVTSAFSDPGSLSHETSKMSSGMSTPCDPMPSTVDHPTATLSVSSIQSSFSVGISSVVTPPSPSSDIETTTSLHLDSSVASDRPSPSGSSTTFSVTKTASTSSMSWVFFTPGLTSMSFAVSSILSSESSVAHITNVPSSQPHFVISPLPIPSSYLTRHTLNSSVKFVLPSEYWPISYTPRDVDILSTLQTVQKRSVQTFANPAGDPSDIVTVGPISTTSPGLSSGFATVTLLISDTLASSSAILGSTTSTAAFPTVSTDARCGEFGNFTMTWDDVPGLIPAQNDTFLAPPVVNAYHHLFSASGYAYVPPGYEPYPPASAPNVAMFFPVTGLLPNLPFAGTVLPGEIGAGPRASIDAYWFHAYSAFFGCDNDGPTDCIMRVSGYQYDATAEREVLAAQQNATIPTCPGFKECHLTPVNFSDQFRNLSGIQFEAFIDDEGPKVFMVDSLSMGWYNNTCSAGILRIGNRK